MSSLADYVNSHILEAVEFPILLLIIPLNRADLVEAVDGGHSIDDMGAKEGVNVVWGEFGNAGPILSPVGHMAHQFIGRS